LLRPQEEGVTYRTHTSAFTNRDEIHPDIHYASPWHATHLLTPPSAVCQVYAGAMCALALIFTLVPILVLTYANGLVEIILHTITNSSWNDFAYIGGREKWLQYVQGDEMVCYHVVTTLRWRRLRQRTDRPHSAPHTGNPTYW
jgi:hypothetical protein